MVIKSVKKSVQFELAPFEVLTFKVVPAAKIKELGKLIVRFPPVPIPETIGTNESPFMLTIS